MKNIQEQKLIIVQKELLPKIKTALGDNLLSVIVYGSVLTPQFNPLTSDINLLIIADKLSPERIIVLGKYCSKTFAQCRITPNVMSLNEFLSSSDIFPMEYLDIKDCHKVIFGEDVLPKLEITAKNLRHQIEDRLRGCINTLRQVLMLSDSSPRLLAAGVRNTQGIYNAIFRAILRLKNTNCVSYSYKDTLKALSEIIGFDVNPFKKIINIRKDTPVEQVISDTITELTTIVEYIDKMENC